VQLSQHLFRALDLVSEIIGVQLPAFLIGDLFTLSQILQRCHNHRSVFRSGHQLVAWAIVFGKTHILPVRAFVGFGMMETISPGQRESAKVGDDPIQLALIPLLQSLSQGLESHPSCRLPIEHQRLELLLEGVIADFGIPERHLRTHLIQIRHDVSDAHAVVNHLRPHGVPELVRFEAIDVSIWPQDGNALCDLIEMIAEAVEAVEPPLGAKEIAFPKEIRNRPDQGLLALDRLCHLRRHRQGPTISLQFVIVPMQARVSCRIKL
jgi:hypothetical protein